MTPIDFFCLVENAYHEARGLGSAGMIAVTQVVLNRIQSPKWPNSACEVVHQPSQFEWTSLNLGPPTEDIQPAVDAVNNALQLPDLTHGATHFHDTSVPPRWAKAFKRVSKIKNMRFYR